MEPIYLDYNATTPIAQEVVDAMAPHLYGRFSNPSSSHPFGVAAKRAVETARTQTAALLGCQPGEVVFTSGGTESHNYAIKGLALARREPAQMDRPGSIIASAIEHRLPNTLNLSFRGVGADTLLSEIGERVAASAGAACHAGELSVSAVLAAMAVPPEWAMGAVRFSVGRGTTAGEIDRAAKIMAGAVRRLQQPVTALDLPRDKPLLA
jgi:cysteine sulfinate desulfinase/cysteine desulfurase-like protein